jgi:hypothetical protein
MSKPLPEPQSHSPVPPCHCERCEEATRQAEGRRLEILNLVDARTALKIVFDATHRAEQRQAKW